MLNVWLRYEMICKFHQAGESSGQGVVWS